jgi:3-oxoacyl-[acyl-carrier protein] reductase
MEEIVHRLRGRIALITGAGNGMGRACAEAYAREGASLALIDIAGEAVEQVASSILDAGAMAIAIQGDVANLEDAQRSARQTVEFFGRIDILVNCAGSQGPGAPVWQVDPQAWMRTVEINLWGTFLMCRYVIPGMVVNRYGRIINVASGAGIHPMPFFSGYSAAKSGVIHFTRTIAEELMPYSVTANAMGVRGITRMWRDVLDAGEGGGETTRSIRAQVEAGMHPEVEENMPLFLFLASDESRHVTGQYIEANSLPGYLVV